MVARILLSFSLIFLISAGHNKSAVRPDSRPADRPRISFTFDDGITTNMPGYPFREWNAMLLQNLEKEGIQAIFFVTGNNKTDEQGRFLLESWNDAGHSIANHTFSHPFYNSDKMGLENFRDQLMRTDSIIQQYSNYLKLFRFPYLKEGNTAEKVDGFRSCLKENGYQNGYVTIDASDWAIDSRLCKKLAAQPDASLEPFRKFYLEHLYDRAMYYENLSQQLNGRYINHTILLHHNLAAALFLDDLIAMFREKGWEILPAKDAYKDPIFQEQPAIVPAGESLIWALAKQSGRFEKELRYPAEDEPYEKVRMDQLGL